MNNYPEIQKELELMLYLRRADNYHCNSPDGAWFAILEENAKHWIDKNNKQYDENDAVHSYIEWLETKPKISQTKMQQVVDKMGGIFSYLPHEEDLS